MAVRTFIDKNIYVRLTAKLLLDPGDHVVEDVEGSLGFGLSDAARLLQQVWCHVESRSNI